MQNIEGFQMQRKIFSHLQNFTLLGIVGQRANRILKGRVQANKNVNFGFSSKLGGLGDKRVLDIPTRLTGSCQQKLCICAGN